MTQRKSQIALEYMIVFSIVLVVFALLFATVATQRVQQQNRQLFSDEEVIAQSISAQLDRALQAGSGYSASVPLATAIGSVNYNLTITGNGAVIVNSTIGGQVVQAISYSSVKSVLSNSTYLASNSAHYVLPIANGSLWIQNSFGTICVDYQCPAASGTASNVSLSEQVTHAGNFNGQSSYVNAGTPTSLNFGTGNFAVEVWVNAGATQNVRGEIVDDFYDTGSWYSGFNIGWTSANLVVWYISASGSGTGQYTASAVTTGVWHQLVLVRQNGEAYFYIDGVLNNQLADSYSANPSYPLNIGRNSGGANYYFNGLISNVQIYSNALSAAQVTALYQEGISGLPISSAGPIGWWPLNGNAQDYSGSGNNGNVIGSLTYPAVAQLFAKVTNQYGQPMINTLVGFATSLGSFNGIGQATTNYTNANGIATAFLNQQGSNGKAYVEATAFNGNSSAQSNLVGWWPLNLGQGSTAADLSGNGNNGAMSYASWSDPNYVANFNGQTSYITLNSFPSITGGGNAQFAISVWAKQVGPSGNGAYNTIISEYATVSGQSPIGLFSCVSGGVAFVAMNVWGIKSQSCPALGTWNHYVISFNGLSGGTNANLYLNGVLVASGSYPSALIQNTVVIGAYNLNQNNLDFFNGSIADVQVYSTALSASQVQQIYQSGISGPPITSSVIGWWPLNGDTQDYSGNGYNGVIYGNLNFASTSSIPSQNANATSVFTGKFNGASSYVAATSNIASGSAGSEVVWISPGGSYAVTQTIMSGVAATGADVSARYYMGAMHTSACSPTGQWWMDLANGATSQYVCSGLMYTSGNFPAGVWTQLAITYDGSNVRFYKNAVLINTVAQTVSGAGNAQPFSIGRAGAYNGGYFSGIISNAQLYNSTLTASQVQQLYQRGIAGLPMSNAGLAGWWPLNGNAQDYSNSGNNGTAIAVNYISQQVTRPYLLSSFNSYGANFNGATSAIGASQLISFPSQLTVSAWAKQIGPGGGPLTTIASEYDTFALSSCYSGLADFLIFGVGRITAGACRALGTWNHYVGTYNGGTMTLYINGALISTYTPNGTPFPPTFPVVIGAWRSAQSPLDPFNGSISDVQLYNVALNANQVQQLYQSQMPPSASASVPLGWMP